MEKTSEKNEKDPRTARPRMNRIPRSNISPLKNPSERYSCAQSENSRAIRVKVWIDPTIMSQKSPPPKPTMIIDPELYVHVSASEVRASVSNMVDEVRSVRRVEEERARR